MDNAYFFIDLEDLNNQEIFPFHLFVFNPSNQKYIPFLFANSPLISEKKSFLEFIIKRKGRLAISKGQKRTFLRHFDFEESDIADLREIKESDEEKEQKEIKTILELSDKRNPFRFSKSFKDCAQNDDFLPLIIRAQKEISCFNLKLSPSVSLSVDLANKLMTKDNHINRIVALSYFIAKTMKISQEIDLSDLINASFFHHIGMTQLETDLSQNELHNLMGDQKHRYEKHSQLSLHLIRKSRIELSDRTAQIIEDHHERVDGMGFPENKKEAHLDPLSLILGLSSFLFDYSSGKINGNPQAIPNIVRSMKNQNFTSGLEFGFSDTILEILYSIYDEETKELLAG